MKQRKFFVTKIVVTVVSEDEPLCWKDLTDVAAAITDGDCSGEVEEVSCDEVDAAKAARLLIAQGSDPEFFGLDEDGSPLEED